ncbi:MAG: DNA repair protein RecO C-terminal domain-containing protein [Methylococcales bacterium]|nr:DNA repair protein RecO C-terminal domain-containing protein [Methylococcales bacterium]
MTCVNAYLLNLQWQSEGGWLNFFTQEQGRLCVWANQQTLPPALREPFQTLVLWINKRGERFFLAQAEWRYGSRNQFRCAQSLTSAYYLNELMLYLLPVEDPYPTLFARYPDYLKQLHHTSSRLTALRCFELDLLEQLGLLADLAHDCRTGEAIQPHYHYRFTHEHGFFRDAQGNMPGRVLLALKNRCFDTLESQRLSRLWLRNCLDYYLDGKALRSRQIIAQLKNQGTPS